MGYAIIDLQSSFKGIKRVTHVTPVKPTSCIHNTLTSVTFEYGNVINNTIDIASIKLNPVNTTANYTFKLAANQAGVQIDSITGRITLSSGFTGGTLVINAEVAGSIVGTAQITGLPSIGDDQYSNLEITKFTYASTAKATGGTCSPTLTYKYDKNGETVTNGPDASISFEFDSDHEGAAFVQNRPGVVQWEENLDSENRTCDVAVYIQLPGINELSVSTQVKQLGAAQQPQQHIINLTPATKGISEVANSYNTWNIETEGVGTLQSPSITGVNSNKFTASISNGILTVTAIEKNTSGSNYTATITVTDGTYSQSVQISQPYVTYYISEVTYTGNPVQRGSTNIYEVKPAIKVASSLGEVLSTIYSDLEDYNDLPGAEQYTISSSKYPASYGTGYVDAASGIVTFDSSPTPKGLQYVAINTINYNTSKAAHKLTVEDNTYYYADLIYDFSDSTSWNSTSVGGKIYGASHSSNGGIQDYGTIYKKASSPIDHHIDFSELYADSGSTLIGTVYPGDKIYVELVLAEDKEQALAPSGGDLSSSFVFVETNNNLSTLNSTATKTVKRIFMQYIGSYRKVVHTVENQCTNLQLFLWDKYNYIVGATIRYKIVRNS